MPVCHDTQAIVLRTWPFGESDKIVSFLTENHGKITGIAKGAKRSRKRFVNSLEPFSLVNLCFQERPRSDLVLIVASNLSCGFKYLLTSLEKISFASYLVEITDGLIGEREENRPVFQHLKNALTRLEQTATLTFLTSFELKLLQLAGYQPSLDSCRHCGKSRQGPFAVRWHFSPRDGGIFCEPCSRLRKENVLLSKAALKEIRFLVLRFIEFHMDRKIKSASFVHQFCSM
jgi:DNA repair protein RecO (recombination protein O)